VMEKFTGRLVSQKDTSQCGKAAGGQTSQSAPERTSRTDKAQIHPSGIEGQVREIQKQMENIMHREHQLRGEQ
jgi:hypothetical protein